MQQRRADERASRQLQPIRGSKPDQGDDGAGAGHPDVEPTSGNAGGGHWQRCFHDFTPINETDAAHFERRVYLTRKRRGNCLTPYTQDRDARELASMETAHTKTVSQLLQGAPPITLLMNWKP